METPKCPTVLLSLCFKQFLRTASAKILGQKFFFKERDSGVDALFFVVQSDTPEHKGSLD